MGTGAFTRELVWTERRRGVSLEGQPEEGGRVGGPVGRQEQMCRGVGGAGSGSRWNTVRGVSGRKACSPELRLRRHGGE